MGRSAPWKKRGSAQAKPREIYDMAIRLREHGHCTMDNVDFELDIRGLKNCFAISRHPFRLAYDAAKEGKPFPEELEA